ncbi:uncharacterized protein LOC121015756 [Herpailurus yagouaroundi]|uniref:uncharacterized protein LOC121015756 n=1 Tax=Herpailurus yagouaroundi TaxID=1608482 RepID=UPI001AD74615|nr:uncharacterized protein LOC121015756 [Puma yagouaroundi]
MSYLVRCSHPSRHSRIGDREPSRHSPPRSTSPGPLFCSSRSRHDGTRRFSFCWSPSHQPSTQQKTEDTFKFGDDQRYQGISLPRHFHATRSPPLDGNPACEPVTVTFRDWTPVLFCTFHRWPKIKQRGQQRRVEVPGSMLRHFNSTWPEHGYACQETTMVLRLQQICPLGENPTAARYLQLENRNQKLNVKLVGGTLGISILTAATSLGNGKVLHVKQG